ncbi:hypothetical protein diail_10781 [Diaporthe ilicicola]|nr:hypothetical protein diail_10781 [Diaporthe ilicicola]
MDELRAVMQQTIAAFVQNTTTAVKKKDVSLLSAVLSDDCAQITNAEYEAQMQVELQTISDVERNVTREVIDAHQRVANVWIEEVVHTVDGSTSSVEVMILGPDSILKPPEANRLSKVIYDLEFTHDGKQISQYIQFVDSFESVKVLEKILST